LAQTATEFTTAPGRFVFGDLYEPELEDFDGNRLVIKNGADKGKETQLFIIGLAIPKTKPHWGSEPGWGETIWAAGHAAFPGGEAQRDGFSWKITDGDSDKIPPKSKSKVRPCDREGHKGCWILRLQSAFEPDIYDAINDVAAPKPLDAVGAVLPGYVIQVVGTIKGNTGASPGVYLNHSAVGLRAYLPVIKMAAVDVKGKFGGALPAGASTIPAAVSIPSPAPPAAGAPPPAAPPPAAPRPPVPAAAPTSVVPAPQIMGIPTAAPPPPALPAAPPGRPHHKGYPYESYRAQGWTDEQLRADGYTG
jgi:hypothetical protein